MTSDTEKELGIIKEQMEKYRKWFPMEIDARLLVKYQHWSNVKTDGKLFALNPSLAWNFIYYHNQGCWFKTLLLRKKFASDTRSIKEYLEEFSLQFKMYQNYEKNVTLENEDVEMMQVCRNILKTNLEIRGVFVLQEFLDKIPDRAARIIQRNCFRWITEPVTKDGKYGIDLRLGLKHLQDLSEAENLFVFKR